MIFSNIINNSNGNPLSSIIFEYVGELKRDMGKIPINDSISTQLLEILKEFKKFNMGGFFHEDTQGCNNIELDRSDNLRIIDLNDVKYYNPNVKLKISEISEISIDLAKVISYIESYIQKKAMIHDSKIIDLYLKKKISLYESYDTDKKIFHFKNKGNHFQCRDLNIVHRLHLANIKIIGEENNLHSEYTDELDKLLKLTENYKDNYELINNLLNELLNKDLN